MRLIDADAFERRCMFDSNIEDMQDVIYALRDYSTVPAIPIPEGATNGDVIKTLFSDMEKIGGMIDETEYSNEHMSIIVDDAWWNKSYKKGDAE